MKMHQSYILILIGLLFCMSCSNDTSSKLKTKSYALGKMNEIVVVADQELWDSPIGDTIRKYFQPPYPLMPSPESMFDLRHFTTEELNNEPLRKKLRTYAIVADLKDETSATTAMVRKDLGEDKYQRAKNEGKPTTSLGRNKWAAGQLLAYVFASGADDLSMVIKNSFPAIAENVHKHDAKQLQSKTYPRGVNKGLSIELKEIYGIDIRIPFEYEIAKEDPDDRLHWFRKDSKAGIMNMVIKKVPYVGTDQFEATNIVDLCNEFGQKFVESNTEGSYLRINDKALPILDYTQAIDNMYTKEIRGVWEMTDDFMGGPFVAYLIHNKEKEELVFVCSFVFAPGKGKRDMVQQLDYIVKSAKSA